MIEHSKRINRGFYRFGDTITELDIVNHKLMARTEVAILLFFLGGFGLPMTQTALNKGAPALEGARSEWHAKDGLQHASMLPPAIAGVRPRHNDNHANSDDNVNNANNADNADNANN